MFSASWLETEIVIPPAVYEADIFSYSASVTYEARPDSIVSVPYVTEIASDTVYEIA